MDDPADGRAAPLAGRNEQIQRCRGEVVLVAIAGDRHPRRGHDEVGPAGTGHQRRAGDVQVVHQGQRLAFSLEAGDNLFQVVMPALISLTATGAA